MSHQDRLTCEIDNQISEIGRLAVEVEGFGERNRLPSAVVSHLNLALDELLTTPKVKTCHLDESRMNWVLLCLQ
jgi:hypothetical protein